VRLRSGVRTNVRRASRAGSRRSLKSASIAIRVAVSGRLVLPGTDYERDGSPAFVFDMMEPKQPKVDRAVLSFLKSEALHPADFTIRDNGVVGLLRVSWTGS
jgi:hypothetical protein